MMIASAAAALGGCAGGISRMIDESRVFARIGVMADTDICPKGRKWPLEKALRFYRQSEVDAVVIVGRVFQEESAASAAILDDLWNKVFGDLDTKLIMAEGEAEVNGFRFGVSAHRPAEKCDVLTFYGGRRLALTDELCFHPRDANAICAGSMHGVEVPQEMKRDPVGKKAREAAQGLLVSAYPDRTVVRRLDFTQSFPVNPDEAWRVKRSRLFYAEDVADPWIIGPDEKGEDFTKAPEFWPDTRIQVLTGYMGAGKICTVKWPSVLKRGTGARARWYEVEVAFADDRKTRIRRKSVLSGGFFLSEDRDLNGAKAVFKESELPSADEKHSEIVFAVTPVGMFGKRGKTFFSEPLPLPRREKR